MDWYETPQPTVSLFVPFFAASNNTVKYAIYVQGIDGLVEIHAQISRVAENLLERGLNALVEDVAESISLVQTSQAFVWWYASRMSRSPPLHIILMTDSSQATLEIEFMHQTLGRYVSHRREDASELYNKISQAMHDARDENLQGNWIA